jgi:hypothetical protein
MASVHWKRRSGRIRFILAFMFAAACCGGDPPAGLLRRVAEREAENERERRNYLYRQTVVFEELDTNGRKTGEYREVREVIFSPDSERIERVTYGPVNTLTRLLLTPEDFRDLREVQPLLLTPERVWNYEARYRGTELVDGVLCWVLQIRPRQILEGQRLFDGLVWVSQSDFSIVRMEGQAVPPLYRGGKENLFPRFTTLRALVDGRHWFPVHTFADDVLPFRSGPQRIRLRIGYADYRRFGAESRVKFQP